MNDMNDEVAENLTQTAAHEAQTIIDRRERFEKRHYRPADAVIVARIRATVTQVGVFERDGKKFVELRVYPDVIQVPVEAVSGVLNPEAAHVAETETEAIPTILPAPLTNMPLYVR
jgi:hypothetical protein